MTIWRELATLDDAEAIRRIRNDGRAWFRDGDAITEEEQRAWLESVLARSGRDFICYVVGDPIVGYGMLQRRDGRLWISLAVDLSRRGQGIGSEIYKGLARFADEEVFAAIRVENIPSRRAAERAGYVSRSEVAPPDGALPEEWIVMSKAGAP